MKPGIPWSVKGIEPEVREAAKDAARRSGMTLGEWLNSMILEQADDKVTAAPSVRMDRPNRPARSETLPDDTTIRLEDIAEQLSRIARREQDTSPARPSYVAAARDPDHDMLARVLNRVESNERQTVEAFSAVNERLTVVGRQIAQIGKVTQPQRPEDNPGYQALEKAMRNIVEHLEVSEKRTRDNLKSMQDRMGEMSSKAALAPDDRVLQSAPAFSKLEQRLSELSTRLERSETQVHQGLPDVVRQELSSLADRIETVREASESLANRAQTQAVQTSQQELRAIEQRILKLLQEAQASFGSQNTSPAELQRIRSEIENLNQRIDGARQGVASDRDVHALRVAVEQLSTRVAQGPDMRPLADMDKKLVDISQRLEQTQASTRNLPQFSELDRRMVELDHRLNEAMRLQGDGQAQIALEQKIAEVSDRMGKAEHQLGHLETIERAINQLFESIEQQRTQASEVAEDAANRMAERIMSAQQPPVSFSDSPEYHALQDGLRVVRESASNADQRNQETLEAVHETLEQIVLKLSELETAAVGHQVATAMQQPIAQNQPMTAPIADNQWNLGPVEPAPRGNFFQQEYGQQQTELNQAAADRGQNPFVDAPENLSTPAVEPSVVDMTSTGSNPFADVPTPAPDVTAPVEPPAPVMTAPVSGDDFIAAARKAAQTASSSKSPLSGLSPGEAPTGRITGKSAWPKFPFKRRDIKAEAMAYTPAAKRPPEIKPAVASGGNRRKLLLMGLVLLAAVSAFTVNMLSGSGTKPPSAPVAIEGTVQPQGLSTQPSTEAQPVPQPSTTMEPEGSSGTAQPPKPQPAQLEGAAQSIEDSNQNLSSLDVEDDILTGSLPNTHAGQSLEALVAGTSAELPPSAIGSQSLRQAAANGDPAAQFIVATRYLEGTNVAQDYAAAAKWYSKAAAAGLAPAQYRIATLYERGKGITQSSKEAFHWYEQAGLQGNVKAMHNAAVIATGPTLGKPDYTRAQQWFEQAANFGLKDSQYNLAVLLERGLGTKPDMEKALFWYMQAAAQGDQDAAKRVEAMSQSLSPARVDAAKLQMKTFVAKIAPDSANLVSVSDASWQNPNGKTMSAAPAAEDSLVGKTQKLLTMLGFNIGEADGQMGAKTANAIRLFQLQSGMKVNGNISPELLQALQAKIS